MAGRLRQVAALLGHPDHVSVPWHLLRYQHVAALRAKLSELGLAPATVDLTLSALRGVARAAFNLELMGGDDYQRIRNVGSVRGERLPAGRAVSQGELSALMDACMADEGPAGVRDAAIIGLMYAAGGMRRSEVVALDCEDYAPDRTEIKVRGKGGKERLAYVDNGAEDALNDWLIIRQAAELGRTGFPACQGRRGRRRAEKPDLPRRGRGLGRTGFPACQGRQGRRRAEKPDLPRGEGRATGPLFVPINGGSAAVAADDGSSGVLPAAKARASAGVRQVSPHDLRRSCVSDLLDAGADISTVSRLVGHASVQTSARYDRRGEAAKRKAVSLLHVPYRRKRRRGEVGESE